MTYETYIQSQILQSGQSVDHISLILKLDFDNNQKKCWMSLSLFCWYCHILVSLHNQETKNHLHHCQGLTYMLEQSGDTLENSVYEGTLEYVELLMFYVYPQRKLSMEYQCWIHVKF